MTDDDKRAFAAAFAELRLSYSHSFAVDDRLLSVWGKRLAPYPLWAVQQAFNEMPSTEPWLARMPNVGEVQVWARRLTERAARDKAIVDGARQRDGRLYLPDRVEAEDGSAAIGQLFREACSVGVPGNVAAAYAYCKHTGQSLVAMLPGMFGDVTDADVEKAMLQIAEQAHKKRPPAP